MIYGRKYVQFNDLVLDMFETVNETSVSVGFKTNSQPYSYRHGSYLPLKTPYALASEQSISLTLRFSLKRLPCDMRQFYHSFVIEQLTTAGKLWAVQGEELVWAYAVISSFAEEPSRHKEEMEFSVDFLLPEGIWHKADLQKTFLKPFDICRFLDCYHYEEKQPCCDLNCVSCVKELDVSCSCCNCNDVKKEWALCYNLDKLQEFYKKCLAPFQIKYDCVQGQNFFGDDYLGERFCNKGDKSSIIAGQLYSTTDIPTTSFTILVHGEMSNPVITINDNSNIIKGEYDGLLIIYSNGDVYYQAESCSVPELVSVDNWEIPKGNSYGWTINPRNNRFIVETNRCCEVTCVYVQVDAITV